MMNPGKVVNSKKGKKAFGVIGYLCGAAVIAVIVLLLILSANKARVVGKNLAAQDITEFYYTDAASTNPPMYQRYHFYKEGNICKFYHEKREGSSWPLTESDITLSGRMELSQEEWAALIRCLEGGKVKRREEKVESGSTGPALYLYWNGDKGRYQEFSFSSLNEKTAFEQMCAELAASCGE